MLDLVAKWLETHEALLSASTALLALIGVSYAVLRFILAPWVRRDSLRLISSLPATQTDKWSLSKRMPAAASTPSRPPVHESHASLAVLRFETLSTNEDDAFLASGIAVEVIALVTQVPDLRVSSRMSTFSWSSGDSELQQAGEQLNADFALTGSLQRAAQRIRVNARLTDIHNQVEIWSHTYDRQLEDLFDVQQDISKSIVGAILGEVRRVEALLAIRMEDHQLDAWGLVQKAYHFWLTNFTVEGILQACEYLRRALAIDPDYASARSALAMLLAQQMTTRICEDYDAVAQEAAEMIEEAYRLAPNAIDVLENAGVVWQNLGESKRGIQALRHCIDLAPLNLIARGYLALQLAFTRGEDGALEARQLLRENFAIAPKHPSTAYWHYFQAVAEQALGNHQASLALCEKSLLGQPGWVHNYFLMANAHCLAGNVDAAQRDLAAAQLINPFLTLQLYLENLDRITGKLELSEAFSGGLLRAGLVQRAGQRPRLAESAHH